MTFVDRLHAVFTFKNVFIFFFSIMLGVFDMEFCIHHDNVHNSAYMRGKKTCKNTHKIFKGLKI